MSPPTLRPWLSALGVSNTTSDAPKPPHQNRSVRLKTSLRRGFISATALSHHKRSAVADLMGTMGPERYVALPPRSHEAAKAATTVALSRGPLEVIRLENFRKSGRIAGGKQLRTEQGGDPWFDAVIDSLLLQRLPDASLPACDVLSALKMPVNTSIAVPRVSQLPREAICVDRVYGCDYSVSVGFGQDAKMDNVKMDVIEIDTDSTPVSILPSPDTSHQEIKLANVAVLEPEVSQPAQQQMQHVPKIANEQAFQPPQPPTLDDQMTDADENRISLRLPDPNIRNRWHVPVSVVFDDAGTVSIDFDIISVSGLNDVSGMPARNDTDSSLLNLPTLSKAKAEENVPVNTFDINIEKSKVDIAHDSEQHAACAVRKDAPLTMLQEMLQSLDSPDAPPPLRSSVPEVVSIVLDEDDDPIPVTPVPSSVQKKSKKRSLTVSRGALRERQQRRNRIRSSVMSTMQDEPEVRRARSIRAARPLTKAPVNVQKTITPAPATRSSRRKKTPIIPNLPNYLDSDDQLETGIGTDPISPSDDDFKIEEAIEILPVRSPAQPKASVDIDKVPPEPEKRREPVQMRKEMERKESVQKRKIVIDDDDIVLEQAPVAPQSSEPLPRNGENVEAKRARHATISTDIPSLDNSVWQVEKILPLQDSGSPALSSLDSSGDERFKEPVSVVQPAFVPMQESRTFLFEVDNYDQHEEAVKPIQKMRDDPPYMHDADSPGTQFIMEHWQNDRAFHTRSAVPQSSAMDSTEPTASVHEPELRETRSTPKRLAAMGKTTQISSDSGGSSDESSAGSYSSENDENYEDSVTHGERSKSGGSRAARARDLQARVCGELLPSMSAEAKRRVLRWAEKDFSWFDSGSEVMEIEATKELKTCTRCDEMDSGRRSSGRQSCEESILLKLWTDMTWRKIRRMRHRKSAVE